MSIRSNQMSALFNAKTIDEVQRCLDRGCDINDINFHYSTPFVHHCRIGNDEIVRELITRGCDINLTTKTINGTITGFEWACIKGHHNIVRMILSTCNIDISQVQQALLYVCGVGNMDIFDLLISRISNVSFLAKSGQTPLMAACAQNQVAIIDRLLALGANVHQASSRGGNTALAYCSSTDSVKRLYVYGANVNSINKRGTTILFLWVKEYRYDRITLEQIQMLIDYGANVNIMNEKGDTPLSYAVKNSLRDLTKLLLANKADPQIPNNTEFTA